MPIVGDQAGLFSPMSIGDTMPEKFGTAMGEMGGFDQNPQSLTMSLMDSIPSATATTGWNVFRASNTITRGGTQMRHLGPYRDLKGGMFRRGIWQTAAHPLKFSSPSMITGRDDVYTPFNALARAGNGLFKNDAAFLRNRVPVVGNAIADQAAAAFGKAAPGEGNLFSGGTIGRMSAASNINRFNITPSKYNKINNMRSRKFNKKLGKIAGSIQDMNPAYYENWSKGISTLTTPEQMRAYYSSGVTGTVDSRFSGKAAGWARGMEARYAERELGQQGVIQASRLALESSPNALLGFDSAAGEKALGKPLSSMGKFVGSGWAGGLLKGAGIAGWIMVAHDVAMGIGKIAGAGLKTMMEAGPSIVGSINKPVMGMGFKDNSVAQSARARGVMAIQNSRLNARSILGSEAGMMAAHFG